MEAPSYMVLTPEEKAAGMRVVRFLDQIVLLTKEGRAARRAFFPSRNSAKRANHYFLRLPRLAVNPKNTETCVNMMVPEAAPRKPLKSQERLSIRIKNYEQTIARTPEPGSYTKPGSMKS